MSSSGERSRRATTPCSVNWPRSPVTCAGSPISTSSWAAPASSASRWALWAAMACTSQPARSVGADQLVRSEGLEQRREVVDGLPPDLDVPDEGIRHGGSVRAADVVRARDTRGMGRAAESRRGRKALPWGDERRRVRVPGRHVRRPRARHGGPEVAARTSATRARPRSRRRPSRRCSPATTSSAWRRPAPARRRRSRCRSSSGSTRARRARRRWSWRPPASSRCRCARPSSGTPPTCAACTCCRSTAARGTASSSPRCAAACTSWSARPAGSWTTSTRARSTSASCATSCSTRPTRCSTWASPTTSSGSSPTPRTPSRWRCSRRRCPRTIRRLSTQYLTDPVEITVKGKTATSANTTQRYLIVSYPQKVDALTRILEVENFEGMIVFVRTKNETETLAEKLRARGFSAQAINGDIPQQVRERTVSQLKRRQARHPRRHRRRRPRARRRADQPRRQLRHPDRHRVLRPPDRPHRPRRPYRRRDLVRHAARALPAQAHREGDPAAADPDAAADRRRRQQHPAGAVRRPDHRGARARRRSASSATS